MGKAATRRRIKRMRYLARLAKEEPERFDKEWEKRLSSWIELIRKEAGRLRDREYQPITPVFERVEEAMAVLHNCGKEIFREYADEAYDILNAECCSQFAGHVDTRLFQMNDYHRLGAY